MSQRKHIAVNDLGRALKQGCPILLRLPEQDAFSLSRNFGLQADQNAQSVVKVRDWIDDRYKGQLGKLYADIRTESWADFRNKLERVFDARKLNKLYVVYGDHMTNASQFLTPNTAESELLTNYKTGLVHQDRERAVGFPRLHRDGRLGLPFVQASKPDTLQWHYIEPPQEKPYSDRFSYVND